MQEGLKTLVVHLIEKFSSKLECIDYVDTYRELKLKYEQVRVFVSGFGVVDICLCIHWSRNQLLFPEFSVLGRIKVLSSLGMFVKELLKAFSPTCNVHFVLQILEGPPPSARDAGVAVTSSSPDHGSRTGRDRLGQRGLLDSRQLKDKVEDDSFNEDRYLRNLDASLRFYTFLKNCMQNTLMGLT